ncbi:heme exporter protein CcmD [Methylobacterium sp. sgz302541]
MLQDHAGFILAAYAFTALVMLLLVGNALRDRRSQERTLAALRQGERR